MADFGPVRAYKGNLKGIVVIQWSNIKVSFLRGGILINLNKNLGKILLYIFQTVDSKKLQTLKKCLH